MSEEFITLELFRDVARFLAELEPSQLVVVLWVVLANMVLLFLAVIFFGKYDDIKKQKMEESLDEVRRIAHDEGEFMATNWFTQIEERANELKRCKDVDCDKIAQKVQDAKHLAREMVHNVFEDKTVHWVKGRFYRNGFHKKKGNALIRYNQRTGVKLHSRNEFYFYGKRINENPLLAIREKGKLYPVERAVEAYSRMVNARLLIIKEQNKEIMSYFLLIKPFVKLFQRDED